MKIKTLCACVFLAQALSGCSSHSKKPAIIEGGGEYKVSVTSNGRAVEDFQENLVNRVDVSDTLLAAEVARFRKKQPLQGAPEKDNRGKIAGLRIRSIDPASGMWTQALRTGDVVTAVERKKVTRVADLSDVLITLKAKQLATLTFERSGRPHKVLFYSVAEK